MLSGKLEGSADGDVEKARRELLENNEVSISVSWKGGGQKLKGRKYSCSSMIRAYSEVDT